MLKGVLVASLLSVLSQVPAGPSPTPAKVQMKPRDGKVLSKDQDSSQESLSQDEYELLIDGVS